MSSELADGEKIGVLLLAFGGPDSLDAVEPFMEKLMKGRKPTPEIIARAKEKYRQIGGKSPLPEVTKRQARALEVKLNDACASSWSFKTYVGMRYWHPFIEEAIQQMVSDGITKAFAISMSPHSSKISTGAYIEEIERVIADKKYNIEIEMLSGMHKNPLFIEAVAEKINSALERFPADKRKHVCLIFSAHSLPMSYIESGDPYVGEIKETLDELLKKIDSMPWYLAYQSKGNIPGKWLGPMVDEVLRKAVQDGFTGVLLVPIGFASDHVETLWDLDILHKKQAEDLGLICERSDALNDSPKFIEALASMVCSNFLALLER
ncbi:MAG: ferrochelatase [Actinomycetota bacterium]|nr:ferrochelatase [Actinomycetota bacterium]